MFVRRQVDGNWFEGERNAMIGIFPVSYVEMVPEHEVGTLKNAKRAAMDNARTVQEGQARAKFNFQSQTPMELSLVKGMGYFFLICSRVVLSIPFVCRGVNHFDSPH